MTRDSEKSLDTLCINTIKTLSIDAVQKANSGHPGTPMALAPAAYVLWDRFLRHSPTNPDWPGRDRFILSAGHASMLLYSLLYLTGYGLSLDDLKRFRQLGSLTPGHPESDLTAGVETTTGPLGQGFANGVGMAIANRMLAKRFNRPGHELINSHIYAICSDGDLMEGLSSEAASLAGHLQLGELTYIYDDNHITIDGITEITFTEDRAARFESFGWHVQELGDNAGIDGIEKAVVATHEDRRPSLIVLRTHIADASPNKHDSPAAHGAPLGEEEVRLTKRNLDMPEDKSFYVPDEVLEHMRSSIERGTRLESEWDERFASYGKEHPELAAEFDRVMAGKLPDGWDSELPELKVEDEAVATRVAGAKAMDAIASRMPEFVGGAADLVASTKTKIEDGGFFGPGSEHGRNIHFGVREHAMGAILNGMAAFGGLRVFGSTFMIFSDYMRATIRLAALMELPVVYAFTHDSFWVGEDGPTHQPIEHLPSLRAIPNLRVIRPADANEATVAWCCAVEHADGPTVLALSRQKLPVITDGLAGADGLRRGAYMLADSEGGSPEILLFASGSEVCLALEARELLHGEGVAARVISVPCWEIFEEQDKTYKDELIPSEVTARVSIEASAPLGWERYVGTYGSMIGMRRFGASAPAAELAVEFGFTAENIARVARQTLERVATREKAGKTA